jgi:anti-sigma regulatory factor (Ser/Thr protein kinase)
VNEVITNAVFHAHSTAVLQARYDGDTLDVRVRHEDDDALPTPRQVTPEDESGRGLLLMAVVADRWGVEPLREGKVVFASFDS